jgi:hypothetical protein
VAAPPPRALTRPPPPRFQGFAKAYQPRRSCAAALALSTPAPTVACTPTSRPLAAGVTAIWSAVGMSGAPAPSPGGYRCGAERPTHVSRSSSQRSQRRWQPPAAATCRGGGCRGGGSPPPGVLAHRIAGRLVVPTGRAARRSRANVQHPAAAQLPMAQPFALDGLPGTTPRRPRSVAGEDAPSARAASLASSAALSFRPGCPWPDALTPTSFPTSTPTSFPTRRGGVPLASLAERISAGHCPSWGQSAAKTAADWPPYGGVVRTGRVDALRAIDSTACPRSWRTCGPRRLRRQSQPLWLLLSVIRHERVACHRQLPPMTLELDAGNARPATVLSDSQSLQAVPDGGVTIGQLSRFADVTLGLRGL